MKTEFKYYMKIIYSVIRVYQRNQVLRSINYLIVSIVLSGILFTSCEKFFYPDQELIIENDDMYATWEEYRSAEMGLYSLQQNLVDQIVVLGELRGDLLEITDYATSDLIEVYNFDISKNNIYASPVNFYKLIGACNKLIVQLKSAHPEVLDKSEPVNNYDRLYGEVLCMRAWAYFNAVRIYGKVPYIYETLTDVEDIEKFVNTGTTYVDSVLIVFAPDGYHNDTIRDTTIVLDRKFLDMKTVIDSFTYQLETKIKAVGVNHYINNSDLTWSVTIWNEYAYHALLGQMYLFDQNYTNAMKHFYPFLDMPLEGSYRRYGVDSRFAKDNWKNIFTGIDPYEHILTLWFNKSYQQTNELQTIFSVIPPNQYMLKPSPVCIKYWETIWDGCTMEIAEDPEQTVIKKIGKPGDFYRGYGVSYKYYKNGEALTVDTVKSMLLNKQKGSWTDVEMLMNDVDTVVTKYSINKNEFAHDANFIIYRAAGVHLYAAEIYAVWSFVYGGLPYPRTQPNTALAIINNGIFGTLAQQISGIRGRVGFADHALYQDVIMEPITLEDIIYLRDPITNVITGYLNFIGRPDLKQAYLIDQIIEEKAREMAFEGERFYDLMRIAQRNNDPAFLADRVSAKFKGADREAMRAKLMNEQNWYVHFFE
jgi:hypothetical protein